MATPGPASRASRPWKPRTVRAGEWRVTALLDGWMRLDGGSMWGVVPATMWREWTPPADDNTILLALRPFLCERGDDVVVIEPGIGDRLPTKWRSVYAIERRDTLVETLAACGRAPADFTHVVASHCHFDHVGAWVVERDGELAPLFPEAVHFAPRLEVEVARDPDHVRRASYRPDDVEPILASGRLETYEGSAELLPGLVAHDAGGHSDAVSVITLNEGGPGDTAIFWADVVPTTHHVQPSHIMAFDIDVERSYTNRSRWIERAADEGWLGLFYHDADHPFGRVVRDGRRFAVELVEGDS